MTTENCSCQTPEIPAYAPSPPVINTNCVECGCNNGFYTPPGGSGGSGGGKAVEVIAGTDIMVEDLSDANTYRFRVNYQTYEALSTDVTSAIPYIAGVNALLNGLMLFGRTYDRVDLIWTQNKTVTSQLLTTTIPGYTPPVLTAEERTKSLSALSVNADRTFTIAGNDGAGQPGSTDSDSIQVLFGNLARWGHGADMIDIGLAANLQALFNSFSSNSINTRSRARSVTITGGVNQYFFYFYPARFGEATFQKGIFVGGFVRLKNVNGTLYQVIPDGETEDDILISNGYASENYYVYQALYDNQNDPVTPLIIS